MAGYIYSIGSIVKLGHKTFDVSDDSFTIVKRITSDWGEISYRIRSQDEAFERVVQERHIEGLAGSFFVGADTQLAAP